jgi:hypothetical protein
MKQFLLAAVLCMAGIGGASAQGNILKVSIFSPLVRTGSFFYEHKVGAHRSFQLGGLFTAWRANGTTITGFALTPEYRFYLSRRKPALQGFYLAPFVRYQNLSLTADEDARPSAQEKASLITYGGGIVAGYQLLFKKRFTLDTFIGPSYNGGNLDLGSGSSSSMFNVGSFQGFWARTGVTLGVAF